MVAVRRSRLSSWVTELLATGRIAFSRDEAMRELALSRRSFLDAAERLQRQKHLLSPRRGFYVIVPPQYHAWGAPPPSWYINELMQFEAHPYYVGILKAAELHGSTHQAVMAFQIISDKRFPTIQMGRSMITFHYRKNIDQLEMGIVKRKTDSGYMNLSSPELTALDLLRYARAAAGINNIVTVLADLGRALDAEDLAKLAKHFERSVIQRLGYLLDYLGYADKTAILHNDFVRRSRHRVELDPMETAAADFTPAPIERNSRWSVTVRRLPEADE